MLILLLLLCNRYFSRWVWVSPLCPPLRITEENFWGLVEQVFMGQIFFLSHNQQCHSREHKALTLTLILLYPHLHSWWKECCFLYASCLTLSSSSTKILMVVAVWHSGNGIWWISKVSLRWAYLVLGWIGRILIDQAVVHHSPNRINRKLPQYVSRHQANSASYP